MIGSLVVPANQFEPLRGKLRGELILPDHPGYETQRRIWNAMIDNRPAAIVRCRDTADVVACVNFARESKLPVSVRGGGHNVAGSAIVEGGLVIDLSGMRAVSVDAERRRAWVQGGAVWGDVDHATQLYGLSVPGGLISTTGVAGFTLGGGIAWTSRKLGLACDNLVDAEVVTASGDVVHASETEHAELLWGLRGGGGNFGVVTSFTFELQPIGPTVYGGFRVFAGERAAELLRFVAALREKSSEELNLILILTTAPPLPFIPPAYHQKPVAFLAFGYFGPLAQGEKATEPIRRIPDPVFEHVGELPYVGLQTAFDDSAPPGFRNYWRSTYLANLPEAAVDVMVRHYERRVSPLTEIHLQYSDGAVGRASAKQSAYGHRDAPMLVNMLGKWEDPAADETNIGAVRALWDDLLAHSSGGIYVNFLADRTPDAVRASYDSSVYARLQTLKGRFDPTNMFRSNHNIPPP